jgi:hypothetical protein
MCVQINKLAKSKMNFYCRHNYKIKWNISIMRDHRIVAFPKGTFLPTIDKILFHL